MHGVPHTRMLASAGTGKTYQLTSRYLRLVLDGVDPTSILATTFTRAAAAEIRDRVLVTAARAVTSEEDRSSLAGRTHRKTLSQQEATSLLSTLLESLDTLRICTLHSFFAQVTGAFAPELGLPETLTILEDDSERGLRDRALARAFERAIDARREDAFLGALAGLAKGAPDRSVMMTVRTAINDGLQAYFQAKEAPTPWLWDARQRPGQFPAKEAADTLRAVQAQRQAESSTRDAIGKNLLGLADKLDEFASLSFPDDLGSWDRLLKTGVASKIRTGEMTYSRVEIDEATRGAIAPLLGHLHALAFWEYAGRTASTYFLLHEYAGARAALEREDGVLTFDDIVRLLAIEDDALLREDIWFRLDCRIQHLLLDEFQDTSLMEWNVLRPLASEIVSDASGQRTFFCVGDVKQSIYGWRGGLPGILEDLKSMIFEGGVVAELEDATLSRSFRSSSEVLEAVNEVFGSIQTNRAITEASAGAADGFARSWKHHETALGDLAGCFELRSVEPEATTSAGLAKACAIEAARLAAEIHVSNPGLEICVLAPKNTVVGHIVELLRADEIDATGEGGGSFLDCGATIVLLDALRLAEHPGDSAAAFNVINSPLGALIGLTDQAGASAAARAIRMSLSRHGLARTIEDWVQAVSGRLDRREIGRLERLVTEAQRVERMGEQSPARAADTLERMRLDEPGGDAIRVMTIHKSKGLAFDVVIITGLDASLFKNTPAFAIDRPMPPGEIRHLIRWVRESVRPPTVEGLHQASRIEHVRERLCQLYVAMTRARRGLFLVVGPTLEKETESMAGILRCSLSGCGTPDPDAGVLARFGLRQALAPGDDDVVSPSPDERARSIAFEVEPDGRSAASQEAGPPSATHGKSCFQLVPPDAGADESRIEGIAWHRLLERITFIEEGVPSGEELRTALAEVLPGREPDWYTARIDVFLATLESPGIRLALSKEALDSEDAEVQVACELPILRFTEENRVQEGIIDRVVFLEEQGVVKRALIIDWKTDRVPAGSHESHAERYREQLASYRLGVSQLWGIDPEQITARIVFVRDGISVDLFK